MTRLQHYCFTLKLDVVKWCCCLLTCLFYGVRVFLETFRNWSQQNRSDLLLRAILENKTLGERFIGQFTVLCLHLKMCKTNFVKRVNTKSNKYVHDEQYQVTESNLVFLYKLWFVFINKTDWIWFYIIFWFLFYIIYLSLCTNMYKRMYNIACIGFEGEAFIVFLYVCECLV